MIKRLLYFIPLLAALSLGACNNDCDDCDFSSIHSRVLFHYMAMDNNLSAYGISNINDMVLGATKKNLNGGAIVVFHDRRNEPSQLLYIHADNSGNGVSEVIHEWEENLDSTNPETFKTAFAMARQKVLAESWALAAGSHGTGWIPASMHSTYASRTRSMSLFSTAGEPSYIRDPFRTETETRAIINDGSRWMELSDMAAMIPDNTFDFIIMDICYMGNIEVVYALRNKAKQMVLSPAEVIAQGMPYDRVIAHIFADEPRLGEGGVAEVFADYYDKESPANSNFATISLYDCTKLNDFASLMTSIVGPNKTTISEMTKPELFANIQTFDRYANHTMFDLGMFVRTLYPSASDPKRIDFDAAIGKLIPYCKTTGKSLEGFVIPAEKYSGVGTYIPISAYGDLNAYYWKTDWGKTVYEVSEE